jgi:hypothetical protein
MNVEGLEKSGTVLTEVLSPHLPAEATEHYKNLSQNSRCTDRCSKRTLP